MSTVEPVGAVELAILEPIDGVELLITWLSPLGETRDTRPSGAVLPYRMVKAVTVPGDDLESRGLYSVHTFAATKPQAQAEATKAHRRILRLVGGPWGQEPVLLGDGRKVFVDRVEVMELPAERQWTEDSSVYRFVGTYRLHIRHIDAVGVDQ